MAVSVQSFKQTFSEFRKTDDAEIDAKLRLARDQVNPNVWGSKTDSGVLYLTAHMLALAASGENAKLKPEEMGKTVYWDHYARQRRQVTQGLRTAGLSQGSPAPSVSVADTSGSDSSAIHVNVSGEFDAIPLGTLENEDSLIFEDLDDGKKKKRVLGSELLRATTAPVELYLRGDGDDSDDGLTPNTAKLTTAGVMAEIPSTIRHTIQIHIGEGTYAEPEHGPRLYAGRVIWNADGAGIGDGTTTLLASEASGAGSDLFKIEKVGGGLTPGAFTGQSIVMESGDAINSRRDIIDNDASFFYVARQIGQFLTTQEPAPGDTYRVFTNNVKFEQDARVVEAVQGFGSTNESSTAAVVGGVAYVGITFTYDGSASFPTTNFNNATVWFFGCKIDTTGTSVCSFVTSSGTLMGGSDFQFLDSAQWPFDEGLAQSPTSPEDLAGWGICELGKTLAFYMFPADPKGSVNAYVVMSALDQGVRGSAFVLMGRLYGREAFASPTLTVIDGNFRPGNDCCGFLQIDAAGTFDAVRATGQGYALLAGDVRINNSGTGRLVLAQNRGVVKFQPFFRNAAGVTGGAIAVEARGGGAVLMVTTPALDGAVPGVDWKVGTTLEGRAFFAVTDDYIAKLDGSVIQKVNSDYG